MRESVAPHNHGPPGTTQMFVSDPPQHFPSGLPPPVYHNPHQQQLQQQQQQQQQQQLLQHQQIYQQQMSHRVHTVGTTPGITPGGGNYLHHTPFQPTSSGIQAGSNATATSHLHLTTGTTSSAQHRPTHQSTFTYGSECVCVCVCVFDGPVL